MLKNIRESKGLSRKEVSELSGINFRSLQDYEQGHKNIASAKGETLYWLSLTLGCTMEEIVLGEVVRGETLQNKSVSSYSKFTGYLRAYSEMMEKYYSWRADIEELGADPDAKIYYLMHRNDIVTTLAFDEVSGNIKQTGKKVNQELLPPGANLSKADLKSWWARRAVPLNQGNIRILLQDNHIPTTQNYLLLNLGLSLSDQYWVNPVDKFYKWEEVNLFTNSFRDELGNYSFHDSLAEQHRIVDLHNRTIFYPSGSLQGELQKKWVIQNGKRYLIKGNHDITSRQSINEVIASLIHERQGRVPFVKYQLCDIEVSGEKRIGCLCEDFCTEKVEFIPAFDVVNSAKKKNDMSMYDHFITVCEEHGLNAGEVRSFLEYQILTDFLISNTDRHFYNFGVLRDSKSLKFIGMAPIFDSGNSMFWNKKKIPTGQELLTLSVNSFLTKEVELLKYVKDPKVVDLDKLPGDDEMIGLLQLDEEANRYKKQILEAYHTKIGLIEQLQNGRMIYKYGYKL